MRAKRFPRAAKGPLEVSRLLLPQGHLVRNDSKRAWGWDHHKLVTLLPEYRKCLDKHDGDPWNCHHHQQSPQANRSPMRTGKFLEQVPTRKSNVRPTHLDFNKTLLYRTISQPPIWKKKLWLSFFCNDSTIGTEIETKNTGRTNFDPYNNLYIYMKTYNHCNLLNPQWEFSHDN